MELTLSTATISKTGMYVALARILLANSASLTYPCFVSLKASRIIL